MRDTLRRDPFWTGGQKVPWVDLRGGHRVAPSDAVFGQSSRPQGLALAAFLWGPVGSFGIIEIEACGTWSLS